MISVIDEVSGTFVVASASNSNLGAKWALSSQQFTRASEKNFASVTNKLVGGGEKYPALPKFPTVVMPEPETTGRFYRITFLPVF